MPKMEKNGMEKLAKVLDSRMGEHSGGGFSFDFGVIKKDYSLVSNTCCISHWCDRNRTF